MQLHFCLAWPSRGLGTGHFAGDCLSLGALMLDALFWVTGLVVWVWIVLMGASIFAINAHDRYEMRQSRDR